MIFDKEIANVETFPYQVAVRQSSSANDVPLEINNKGFNIITVFERIHTGYAVKSILQGKTCIRKSMSLLIHGQS